MTFVHDHFLPFLADGEVAVNVKRIVAYRDSHHFNTVNQFGIRHELHPFVITRTQDLADGVLAAFSAVLQSQYGADRFAQSGVLNRTFGVLPEPVPAVGCLAEIERVIGLAIQ